MTRAAPIPAWFDLPTVACKGRTSIMFDGADKGDGTPEAKAICARCPHVDDCRQYAMDNAMSYGVWGGEGPRTRWRAIREAASDIAPTPTTDGCGTLASYKRHMRNVERPCQPCKDAWAAYKRERAARMKWVAA